LKLCTDFHAFYFYNYFDLDKNKKIIPSSMLDYLSKFKISVSMGEIYILFKRVCKNEDSKMSIL
jgi:hypothetical protein